MSHYLLTPEFLQELNQADLTFSEYRLLLYCLARDPYQETWVEFSTTELIQACNFKSAGTLSQAMKKLRNEGLLSFVWERGKFSTTPQKFEAPIAVAIERSLQRSRFRHSDRSIATENQNQPESRQDKDSENRSSLNRLSSSSRLRDQNFSELPDPSSQDYWNRLYGSN